MPSETETISVLIIEDDEVFCQTLDLLFKKQGAYVCGVASGEEAIALARENVFDVIVADIRLAGDLDGLETVEKIKSLTSQQKKGPIVIMVTGSTDLEAPIRAIKIGVAEFIVKPVQLEYLIHAVQRHLRMRHLEFQERDYLRQIEERTRRLSFFFEIGRELTSVLDLNVILDIIVDRTVHVLDAERCSIMLGNENGEELHIAAAQGISAEIVQTTRVVRGEMICGWIYEKGTSLLVDDLETDPRFNRPNEARYTTHSFIGVPLLYKNKSIGVINVSDKRNEQVFSQDDLILLEGIADQAAIAIANARFYRNLQMISLQVVASLTSTIEMKDHYTRGHSDRVTAYAVAIAEKMGLAFEDIEVLRTACELHDLGKIGIHDNVLTKQGKLTDEEMEEMRSHSMKGADILRPLTFLNRQIVLIEQHHERYDGTGYPFGFKGDQITLGARIMSAADCFDAMTTNRPYSQARTRSDAIAELRRSSGSQLDPQVVAAFLELLQDEDWAARHLTHIAP